MMHKYNKKLAFKSHSLALTQKSLTSMLSSDIDT